MTKFNLKEHIAKNKATFFGSLTEGQFSWMTQDTGQQIGSQDENKISVYMFDNKGKYWFERDYDGYGVFGGMDYYELLDKMNGGSGDRSRGIDLAFDKSKEGETLFPALVVSPSNFNYKTHDFTKEAEHDPNQSWYEPEEDDFYDQNDEEEYGYNDEEEELDENKENLKESVKILDRQADLDQAYFNLDVDGKEMSFTYWDYDEEFDNATYEEVMYMIEKQLINVDKYGFPVDPQLTPEQKEEIAQVVLKDLQTNPGWKSRLSGYGDLEEDKKKYYKDAEADDAEHIKALEKDMKDDKKASKKIKENTKMKVSEFKAKIKEMILAEMNLDVTDETSGYDFLAELEGMLDDEEEFSVTLLVPTVYYNPETGELAKTSSAFGADSELEDMGITNYSDGDELIEWVFDGSLEKAKYFEKEYPGLFKVEGAMNEAEDDKHIVMKGNKFYTGTEFVDDMKDAMKYNLKSATEIAKEKKGMVYTPKAVKEAKKDEEVEDEVDIDIESPEAMDAPMGGINVTQNADADLTGTEKEVQDNLEAAMEAAKKLGDEKLSSQIGNTLTFFTRQHVVKENLKETLLLQKRAGIITETQYKQKLNEISEDEDEVPLTSKVKSFINKAIADSKKDGEFEELKKADWFENELIDELISLFPNKDYDSASSKVTDYIKDKIK
jgi:hypothetical protein